MERRRSKLDVVTSDSRVAEEPSRAAAGDNIRLAIEYVSPNEITCPSEGLRIQDDCVIRAIAEAMNLFGFVCPLVVDENKNLIIGHARLKAAKLRGATSVPIIRLSHLTPAQLRALAIADNRLAELSSWNEKALGAELRDLALCDLDFRLEITGFTGPEIDHYIQIADGQIGEDEIPPAVPTNARATTRLLAERCSYQVPRLLFVSEQGFDLRQMVPGSCDPWDLFYRCQTDLSLSRKIGRFIGSMLAEQHVKINEADVSGWLPQGVAWPEPSQWIRERLPHVVDDRGLIRLMERVIERYEAVSVDAKDRVLVHGDVGLHNLAFDPHSDTVNGVFDYDSAAWADRHHDFRYLVFDIDREDMLDSAVEIYESATGHQISRDRVRLYNAACAISFLAFRMDIPPDQRSCGRTLAEDLQWVRAALSKVA